MPFPAPDSLEPEQDLTSLNLYGGYEQYDEVIFNVYLFKGTHHFVQCTERLDLKHETELGENAEAVAQNLPSLCTDKQTYFPLKRNFEASDNMKIYVRPLECKLLAHFSPEVYSDDGIGKEAFLEKCVDLEHGDAKPEIRVHGNALFNITNFAQFENIQFTGEDNLF